jgi:RNA polymerase sigma-70 factor (ECF subfamily)
MEQTAPFLTIDEVQDTGYAEMVRRATGGEEEAREALYRWAFPALHRYLYHRAGGDPDLTADLCADTFVAAFRDLTSLSAPDAFWPWLLKIAQRRLADHQRQRCRQRKAVGALVAVGAGEARTAPDPEADMAADDERSRVRQAFSALAPDYQDVLRLCVVEGLSQAQAAERLGRSEKAVESLSARAREALRKELRKQEPAFDPGL